MRISDWSSDVCSSDLPRADGCRFTVHFAGDRHDVRLRMPGRHNAMNALAAIAAARAVNIPVAQSVAALADFAGLARRYEVLGQAAGVTVIDDFAHNPDKRSEEHTSELQSLMRISYAVFCLK